MNLQTTFINLMKIYSNFVASRNIIIIKEEFKNE